MTPRHNWPSLALPLEGQFDSVSSPEVTQSTTGRPGLPALIEVSIPLPGLTQLRNKSYLAQLYTGRHLSARQIARLTEVSHSTVLAALERSSIPPNSRNRTHPGQLNERLVPTKSNAAWQANTVRLILART